MALEDDFKNNKRCGQCIASLKCGICRTNCNQIRGHGNRVTGHRKDTSNAAANVSAAQLDSIEPVDPRVSDEGPSRDVQSRDVQLEWNGRRRRTACSKSFYFQHTYKRRSTLPTKDELEVADFLVTEDFRSKWASGLASDYELVATATRVQLKKDPNYSAPVQKESHPKRNQTRRGRRS